MKTIKISLIVVFCFVACISYSQGHLKFNDLSMTGYVADFGKALKEQGFTVKETVNRVIVMSGTYRDKPCEIMIYPTKLSNIVRKITVTIALEKNWLTIKNEYTTLKQSFTALYGAPKSVETFTDPYFEGDGCELKALKIDKINYASEWEVKQGNIELILSKYRQLVITFQDAFNSELQDKEEMERVMYD